MPVANDPVEVLQVRKLLQCVRTDDYKQIKNLCEKGVEFLVNYNEPKDGQTALILAAIQNNEPMLEFLLEIGAHPNIVDFRVLYLMSHSIKSQSNPQNSTLKTSRAELP